MAKTDRISLYQELHGRGYEASVIATYNVNFPFYERVVLRRLLASGCRHNVVLADARQCGIELGNPHATPQLCGAEYALIPVSAPGAFHAKFVLLLGRKKARLILGSHNLTLSGFGLNREIATVIDVLPGHGEPAAARAIWRFVDAWTSSCPTSIRDVIAATERMAPWLGQTETNEQTRVLTATRDGPSLWEQLASRVDGVERISIVSPYFDQRLAFVERLVSDLRPRDCIIGVHPEHSQLPDGAADHVPAARFVDLARLGTSWAQQRLHAKLCRFELTNGTSLVISGSANASRPAWLDGPSSRNAETIFVEHDAASVWKRLGLHRLADLPDITDEQWIAIRKRTSEQQSDMVEHTSAPYLACETEEGFTVDSDFVKGVSAADIRVHAPDGPGAAIDDLRTIDDQVLCAMEDPRERQTAIRMEVEPTSGGKRVALIHHVSHLIDKAAGSTRQAFRRAMNDLEGNPNQLTELIKIVEKAIFDEPVPLDAGVAQARKQRTTGKTVAGEQPDSLAVPVTETARRRRKRRLSSSSNLALIIDALIYRLGLGLGSDPDTEKTVRPPEEALRDGDQQPPEPPDVDGHALAKLCRSKVNRLFRRMVGQMERAIERGDDATTTIVQLSAVLGVVKHLRASAPSFEWLPRGEEVIDTDHEWSFFKESARRLYAPSHGIVPRALTEHDGRPFDELTTVRALLTWLALDCGLDAREATDSDYEREEVEDNLEGLGYFLPVLLECGRDKLAADFLTELDLDDGREEAAYHLNWASEITSAIRARTDATSTGIELGDVVLPSRIPDAQPAVVVEVSEKTIGILNLNTGGRRLFARGFVTRIGRA